MLLPEVMSSKFRALLDTCTHAFKDSMSHTTAAATSQPFARVFAFLAVGVLAASMSSIVIRFAHNDGLPSLLIAAGRLTVAALLLTPFALSRHRADLARLRKIDLLMAGAS